MSLLFEFYRQSRAKLVSLYRQAVRRGGVAWADVLLEAYLDVDRRVHEYRARPKLVHGGPVSQASARLIDNKECIARREVKRANQKHAALLAYSDVDQGHMFGNL